VFSRKTKQSRVKQSAGSDKGAQVIMLTHHIIKTTACGVMILFVLAIAGYPQEGRSTEAPIAQVVNNCGTSIFQVGIGGTGFSENLSMCADGCSTPFKKVRSTTNAITVQMTAAGSPVALGNLGVFKAGGKYSVNIIRRGPSMCAELYSLKNTDIQFNKNKSKQRVGEVCRQTVVPLVPMKK
jgi:hypothetical protein